MTLLLVVLATIPVPSDPYATVELPIEFPVGSATPEHILASLPPTASVPVLVPVVLDPAELQVLPTRLVARVELQTPRPLSVLAQHLLPI